MTFEDYCEEQGILATRLGEDIWNQSAKECAKRCLEIVGQSKVPTESLVEIAGTIAKEFIGD